MVGANTFREPALTAKMATTLDHISNGRAILGIGGAWFEEEHIAFGIQFGSGFPERLRWLGEALPIMRGMLHGERPTRGRPALRGDGRPQRSAADPGAAAAAHRRRRREGHAQARRPLRRREQRRRRDRERPAQGGDPARALRDGRARPGRDRADDRHRDGRHPRLARRGGTRPRRDVRAQRACRRSGRTSRSARRRTSPSGSCRSSSSATTTSSRGFPSPHDEESMTRLATEVKPILERG